MAEKIRTCGPKLRVAFQNHLVSLPDLLLAEYLITDDNASEIRATARPEPVRASRLLEFIRNKVKVNSDNYNVFVKALQEDIRYRDILIILGEKCPPPKDSPAAAPATSNTCLSITDLSKVFRELYAAHTKWYNIGLELGMNPHDLDTIRADYRDKPDECFRELLSRWLKNDSKPTWPVLVSALKSPTVGLEMLSEQVKQKNMSTVGSNEERQSVKSKGIEIGDLIIFSKEIIGQGAFGTVFKGEWQQIPCAAKMLSILGNEVYTGIKITQQKGAVQEEAIFRFKMECEFMKTLRHPNVVAYYDTVFHPETNIPVLVMELMGTSLCHYITNHADSLSERVQLNICHNIAAALEFLHSKNIIHRDLCGENVLLDYSGDIIPVAKVTDFGVSRKNIDMTHSLTAINHRPGYLPPEAPEYPTDYDSSLDIFMFGAVMTQIAMKWPAIKSKGERQKLVETLRVVGHPLNSLIFQCLEYTKENRPEASALCTSLHSACKVLATGTHGGDMDRIAEEMQRLCPAKLEEPVQCQSEPLLPQQVEDFDKEDLELLYDKLELHAARWRNIGTALGFLEEELDSIGSNLSLLARSPNSRLREMLSQWLTCARDGSRGGATRTSLRNALIKVNLSDAVRQILDD